MVDKIETSFDMPSPTKVEFNTIIKNKGQYKAGEIINRVLYAIIALLLMCIMSTFFVEKVPDFVLDLRSFAIDSIWLMLCCYTVGELVKLIFFNKARCTTDYEKALQCAETALNTLTPNERNKREEYCQAYAKGVYNRKKTVLLNNANITEEEYDSKYFSMTYWELKARYKDLSKAQRKNIAAIGRLKMREYDPSFLMSTEEIENDLMPSEMHNARKEDKRNKIKSALLSVASGFFCVTLAGELIFSFSISVLFMAVVKITSVVLFSSFKATFGWNLAMYTEISRYKLQVREVANLKYWYKEKYGEV